MLSSPACGLKQYIASARPDKLTLWTDVAQATLGTYMGEHEREDLEVFKCVQIQCETPTPQDTSNVRTCDICAGRFVGIY